MSNADESIQRLLWEEQKAIGDRIISIYIHAGRSIAFAFVVLTIAASVIFSDQKLIDPIYVYPIISLTMYGALMFSTLLFTEVASLAGYKKYLEERINKTLKQNVTIWELNLTKFSRNSFVIPTLLGMYIAGVISVSVYGVVISWNANKVVFYVYLVLSIILTVASLLAFLDLATRFKKVYEEARRASEDD